MQKDPLEKKTKDPLYKQMISHLRSDIRAGVYPAGSLIPSESELCKKYSVSRVTVRKAALQLAQEGLLIRRQGKGTFVADDRIQSSLKQVTSFTDACREKGHIPSTRLISATAEDPSPADTAKLRLHSGEKTIVIRRLRLSDGEPVMLEVNCFPGRYDFLLETPPTGSLYELLSASGLAADSAEHEISLAYADEKTAELLGTETGAALLLLNETVLDQHGEPLHTSRQWIRGDKYTFRI